MMQQEKSEWKRRALDELRRLSITVIYIWVLLSVFTLHREIILANYHINYSAKFGFAFINAVILAKFMWLGEILHAGKKAAGKALLYSTLWNSAIFTVLLIFATMQRVYVVLIPFFFAKGLIEILGKDEIERLLFRAHTEG
jgi:hypothetical protein